MKKEGVKKEGFSRNET